MDYLTLDMKLSIRKFILFCLFVGGSSLLYSQEVRKDIKTISIAGLKCNYSAKIIAQDTTYSVFCGFKNMKYKHITDIGSVFMPDSSALYMKIYELESCLPYLEEKGVSFSMGNFKVYDFASILYIYDREKYTTLNKDEVEQLVAWLNGINWGSWSTE